MTLPTALVVGPMKCGTSWIHDYLKARGDVSLPRMVKETFYFDRFHDRGLDWYAKRFNQVDPVYHQAIVEVAPSLFHRSNDLPQIIRAELGDIPILITLRDPVDRAWSHYRHMRRGYTRATLSQAAQIYPEIIEASRYSQHVPAWQMCFSRVTVLHQRQLVLDAEAYAIAVSEALDITPVKAGIVAVNRSNVATTPRSYWLAKSGRIASNALRRAGFYGPVEWAKKRGLKEVFFGAEADTKEICDADRHWIRDQLTEDDYRLTGLTSENKYFWDRT